MTQLNSIDTRPVANDITERTVKTALDCDVLTLVQTAKAREMAAACNRVSPIDPMDQLYRPLGNRDLQSVLYQR